MNRTAIARLAYGTLLVAAPGVLLGRGIGADGDRRFRTVVRVLGLRHLIQALVLIRWPTRAMRRAGAAVDGLHAATDIGCGLIDERRRRGAFCDAGVALAFAFAGASAAR